MGMAYEELNVYARLREMLCCGPVSMFQNLCHKWGNIAPSEVAAKVKYFFKYYAINGPNLTVLTPAYHAESYSLEYNRFDLRQFLYNKTWPYQSRKNDELVCQVGGGKVAASKSNGQENGDIANGHGNGLGVVATGPGNPKAGL
ncbi:glutamine-dependent NAD(+) synthetase-like [Magnolia sinica]|uniref:glutamine-dependent NAD(+) synthetase-like n=1 Tax=Magnolia sinica TaxID=86752 RepID=UPI002658F50B|nr:glutamine-dependent NAD(+) synthetase-like [Magnolia sinica]